MIKMFLADLLALIAQAEMCSLVEEHPNTFVRQLVAKAVFVGVVHPFGDPQERLRPGQAGGVSISWIGKNKKTIVSKIYLVCRV